MHAGGHACVDDHVGDFDRLPCHERLEPACERAGMCARACVRELTSPRPHRTASRSSMSLLAPDTSLARGEIHVCRDVSEHVIDVGIDPGVEL